MRLLCVLLLLLPVGTTAQQQPAFLGYLNYRLGMSYEGALNAPLPQYFVSSISPDWSCRDYAVEAGRSGKGDRNVIESCTVLMGARWRHDDPNVLTLFFLSRKLIGLSMTFDRPEYESLKLAFQMKYKSLKPSVTTNRFTNAFGAAFEGEQVTYTLNQQGIGITLLELDEIEGNRDTSCLTVEDTIRMKAWQEMKAVLTLPLA